MLSDVTKQLRALPLRNCSAKIDQTALAELFNMAQRNREQRKESKSGIESRRQRIESRGHRVKSRGHRVKVESRVHEKKDMSAGEQH